MFRKVELQTARGDLVYRGAIPNFAHGYPVMLLWGVRTFLFDGLQDDRADKPEIQGGAVFFSGYPDDDGVFCYRECFAFAVSDLSIIPGWNDR